MDEATHAIAEAQASEDAAIMAALQARTEALRAKRAEHADAILADVAEGEEKSLPVVKPQPMNRAERRAQVKFYATVLAQGNKQVPYVDPTIRPKSQRRRRAH